MSYITAVATWCLGLSERIENAHHMTAHRRYNEELQYVILRHHLEGNRSVQVQVTNN